MVADIHIRRFRAEDAEALYQVFYSAVHLVARHHYTTEQLNAWAPSTFDHIAWAQRMRKNNPFVAELKGKIVGYADLQASGYIDHFYVSGDFSRQGIGSQLMEYLLSEARLLGLVELTSEVSFTAQPIFAKYGFVLVQPSYPERGGVVIPNALMRRK